MDVDVIDDPVEWAARHPGLAVPTGTMVETEFAPTVAGFTGKPWHACVLCGHVDKEAAMTKVGGKWYCSYSGCAVEVMA